MLKKLIVLIAAIALPSAALAAEKFTFDEKTLILRGEVTGESVAALQLAILSSPEKELTLVISSPGGSVLAGAQLTQTIRDSGKKIKCVATFAASMAFAILQSCQERYVLDSSIIMQHVMAYGLEGQEPNNYSLASALHRLNKRMDQEQADRIGISYKEFREKVRDDWWLLGDEAVDANAADGLATATCTQALTKKKVKAKVQMMFWMVDVEWSGCPLIQSPVGVKSTANDEFAPDTEERREEYRKFMEKLDVGAYLKQKYILSRKDVSKK